LPLCLNINLNLDYNPFSAVRAPPVVREGRQPPYATLSKTVDRLDVSQSKNLAVILIDSLLALAL
jgi:hypothetical protein